MLIKVKVTKENIEKGRPGECLACPIKLAFMDLGFEVKVDTKILIYQNQIYELPKEAIYFIDNFDNHREIEPFEFEMVL